MAGKKTAQPAYMSQKIDILHPVFLQWFGKKFPECQKVVIFDKDETLFTTVNGRRSCFAHLIKEVLFALTRLKPKVVLVMYTEAAIEDMQMDLQLFPEVFSAFDIIISADNYSQPLLKSLCNKGVLCGDPLMLQLLRMCKPVDKIFAGYPVVLIDDHVGTDWISVTSGKHGLKPYNYAQDNPANAKKLIHKMVKQLKQQK